MMGTRKKMVEKIFNKFSGRSKGELEMKLCDCPYNQHCHEPRQWVARMYNRPSEKCEFYQAIKESLEGSSE